MSSKNSTRGVVILPAIAGVNNYILQVESTLAAGGWQTEMVDYFRGGPAPDLNSLPRILETVDKLDDTQVLLQVDEAVARLRQRGISRIAALGYCIGGTYAMLSGARIDGLSACANYYGALEQRGPATARKVSVMALVPSLRVPTISHYGTSDTFVPPAHVDALQGALEKEQKTFELFRYGGAPHAFDESHRPSFRPVAAQEAWARTNCFLDWYTREQTADASAALSQ